MRTFISQCGRGFTLIELLVVISIIALLISILMPALANAREAAEGAQCLSNQKQIMIAMVNYQVDNRDYFMPLTMAYIGGVSTTSNPGQWTSQMWRLGYTSTPQLYDCPSFDGILNWSMNPDDLGYYDWSRPEYGYNYRHVGGSYRYPQVRATDPSSFHASFGGPARSTDINTPGETIVTADTIDLSNRSLVRGYFWVQDSLTIAGTYAQQAHGRHGGPSVSIAWADGHASMFGVQDEFNAYEDGLGQIRDGYWDRN